VLPENFRKKLPLLGTVLLQKKAAAISVLPDLQQLLNLKGKITF